MNSAQCSECALQQVTGYAKMKEINTFDNLTEMPNIYSARAHGASKWQSNDLHISIVESRATRRSAFLIKEMSGLL